MKKIAMCLAAAVHCKAPIIVTFNLRHFRPWIRGVSEPFTSIVPDPLVSTGTIGRPEEARALVSGSGSRQ